MCMLVQALQIMAASCCKHSGCAEEWQELALASSSKAIQSAGVTLCSSTQLHCTQKGKVVELNLAASGFLCDVSALKPLNKLDGLAALTVAGVGFTGLLLLFVAQQTPDCSVTQMHVQTL